MDNESDEKCLVRYENHLYDISDFMKKHPGGINTLGCMHNMDIDYKFENAPPHSAAAKYLMKEYRVRSTNNNNDGEKSFEGENSEWDRHRSTNGPTDHQQFPDMQYSDDTMEVGISGLNFHFLSFLSLSFTH